MAGEVVVGVLRGNEPGCAQDSPRVFAWRREDVDGVIAGAVADNQPLVAEDDDAGLRGGMPGVAASAQDGASPSWEACQSLRQRGQDPTIILRSAFVTWRSRNATERLGPANPHFFVLLTFA
jgi:hypothetical protein